METTEFEEDHCFWCEEPILEGENCWEELDTGRLLCVPCMTDLFGQQTAEESPLDNHPLLETDDA